MKKLSDLFCFVLIVSLLALSCDTVNSDSDQIGVFVIEKETFTSEETINVSFLNNSSNSLYLVSYGCSSILQKQIDGEWQTQYYPNQACAPMISYNELQEKESIDFSLLANDIKLMTSKTLGMYRFIIDVAFEEDYEKAKSRISSTFKIIK